MDKDFSDAPTPLTVSSLMRSMLNPDYPSHIVRLLNQVKGWLTKSFRLDGLDLPYWEAIREDPDMFFLRTLVARIAGRPSARHNSAGAAPRSRSALSRRSRSHRRHAPRRRLQPDLFARGVPPHVGRLRLLDPLRRARIQRPHQGHGGTRHIAALSRRHALGVGRTARRRAGQGAAARHFVLRRRRGKKPAASRRRRLIRNCLIDETGTMMYNSRRVRGVAQSG